MLKFFFIWLVFSIIVPLLIARIIGRTPKIIFYRIKSHEDNNWFVKDLDVQKANWYINECPPCNKLDLDRELKKENMMKIGLN